MQPVKREDQLRYLASLVEQIKDGKTPLQIAREHGWTLAYTFERIHQGREFAKSQPKPANHHPPWAKDTR